MTVVPFGTAGSCRSTPQAMPAGLLVTVPLPVPSAVTVTIGLSVNVAMAARSAVSESVHVVEVPEQAPLQPAKRRARRGQRR